MPLIDNTRDDKNENGHLAGGRKSLKLDTRINPVWAGIVLPLTERIERLDVIDHDNDAKRDIAVTTEGGNTLYLDFAGSSLDERKPSQQVQFRLLGRKR